MVEIYKGKGFTHDEATRIMELLTKKKEYHDYFVEHMVRRCIGRGGGAWVGPRGRWRDLEARVLTCLRTHPRPLSSRPPLQLVHELGHMLPGEGASPVKNGLVTFTSFMIFGSLPLWPYVSSACGWAWWCRVGPGVRSSLGGGGGGILAPPSLTRPPRPAHRRPLAAGHLPGDAVARHERPVRRVHRHHGAVPVPAGVRAREGGGAGGDAAATAAAVLRAVGGAQPLTSVRAALLLPLLSLAPPDPPPLPARSALQAVIVKGSLLKQGVLMVVNGGLAAGASYLVGWGLAQAVGGPSCE
jgi:hypothetical protein